MCICCVSLWMILCHAALWPFQRFYESSFGWQIIFAKGRHYHDHLQFRSVDSEWCFRRRLATSHPTQTSKINKDGAQTVRNEHNHIHIRSQLNLNLENRNTLSKEEFGNCATFDWDNLMLSLLLQSFLKAGFCCATSYPLQKFVLSWIHCPCLETHWSRAEL